MLVRSGQVIRCTHHQSCPPSWKVSPCVYNWPSIPKGFSWFEDLQPRRSSNQLPPKGGPGSYKTHVLSSRRRAQANARLESRAGRSARPATVRSAVRPDNPGTSGPAACRTRTGPDVRPDMSGVRSFPTVDVSRLKSYCYVYASIDDYCIYQIRLSLLWTFRAGSYISPRFGRH